MGTPVSPLAAGDNVDLSPPNSAAVALIRSINGIVFDAVLEEVHESELMVTDNPCEVGVAISDHAYMKPVKVTVTAAVSDDPLHDTAGSPFSGAQRSNDAYYMLQLLQQAAEPFDVQTGLLLYHDMVVMRLSTTQDKDTPRILVFQAELRQIIWATTATVTYPPRAAGSPTNQGSQSVTGGTVQAPPPPPTAKPPSSGGGYGGGGGGAF